MNFNSYKPLRLIELFAGIGAQAKALTNLGINYEHWYVCEWDKYAIKSYNAVHGTNFNPSDITKLTASDLNIIDTEHYNYLVTYSFPCQDLSNAGKGRGMEKGSGTRSGLLWEVERLLNECTELPQVLLMENVPQVHGAKNKEHFDKWIAFLESKGYTNYWKDLNAKNYGIPQNRNRCYMVSVLGGYTYAFPEPVPLELTLKDLLEKEVDEKYYLSDSQAQKISQWKAQQKPFERVLGKESISPTLTARGAGENHSGMVLLSEELNETTNLDEKIKQHGVIVSKQGKKIDKFTDVAATLMARDYKGFGNQGMTGVAVISTPENTWIDNIGDFMCPICGSLSEYVTPHCPNCGAALIEPTKSSKKSELKKQLCKELLDNGLVEEGDVIRHSYTNNRLKNGVDNMSRTESKEKLSPTLDTRCDCLGVVVKEPSELQKEVCNKAIEQGRVTPYDIIDYTYSNARLSEIMNGKIQTKNGTDNQIANTLTCNVENMGVCVPTGYGELVIYQRPRGFNEGGIKTGNVPSITSSFWEQNHHVIEPQRVGDISELRIRKLTPKECWRLMGFSDEDVEKAAKVCSNSQLYKQAGNSIVVNVLMAIFKELFVPKKTRSEWLDELLGGV